MIKKYLEYIEHSFWPTVGGYWISGNSYNSKRMNREKNISNWARGRYCQCSRKPKNHPYECCLSLKQHLETKLTREKFLLWSQYVNFKSMIDHHMLVFIFITKGHALHWYYEFITLRIIYELTIYYQKVKRWPSKTERDLKHFWINLTVTTLISQVTLFGGKTHVLGKGDKKLSLESRENQGDA